LKDSFEWKYSKIIPTTEIEPIIFFSRCFIKVKFKYNSSEFEITYLIWAYKQLYILLYSNNKYIVVLIDHEAICGIVNTISLNILSTDRINCRLTNASVYLSAYPFDVYYIFGQFNFVSDMFSYLQILEDDTIRTDEIIEPALDVV